MLLFQNHNQSFNTQTEANRTCGLAADFLHQLIISAAAAYGQPVGYKLKYRSGVIIQATHNLGINGKGNAVCSQNILHLLKMCRTFLIQTIQHRGRICHDFLTAFHLAVQHTQRILFKTLLAGRAKLVQVPSDKFLQCFVVSCTTFGAAKAVHAQLYALHAHFLQ